MNDSSATSLASSASFVSCLYVTGCVSLSCPSVDVTPSLRTPRRPGFDWRTNGIGPSRWSDREIDDGAEGENRLRRQARLK